MKPKQTQQQDPGLLRRTTAEVQVSRVTANQSCTNTIQETNNEDEDNNSPIGRGRRRRAHVNPLYTAVVSKDQFEREKQLKRESGFSLQVKPGRHTSQDEKRVEYDALVAAPSLVMSRDGLPGYIAKAPSTGPSQAKRSQDQGETVS